jgi:hypothetical protein
MTMSPVIRMLTLACLAMLPVQAFAQAMPSMTRDLGFIPDGQERMFQLRGRLNLDTATQEEATPLVERTAFSFSANSGFCVAAMAPAAPTVLFLVGRERRDSPVLFDVNTGPAGLSSADGRRTFVRTVAPIDPTSFLLATIVGQTSAAPGDTVTLFVRVYPDTTPRDALDAICGPQRQLPPN